MTKSEFIEVLEQQQTLSTQQTRQLASLCAEFPYFQSARALYLKGLKQNHSFSYNAELKKTAAHTTDRSILFEYITSEAFKQHHISGKIKSRIQEETSADSSAYEMKLEEAERVFDPALFENISSATKEKQTEEKLGMGQPLQFESSEAHSFSEWLQLTRAKPIQQKEETRKESETTPKKEKKFQLIDEFIAKSPKIIPSKELQQKTPQPIAEDQGNQLMTETLAKVYLEQKNFDKAIQAFKILILKNPEKSGFFADQIRAIEKIKQNKNI